MKVRTDPEELRQERHEVEALTCGLPTPRAGDAAFDEAWEIRVFAIAVAAYRQLGFDWSEFQGRLSQSIAEWESNDAHGAVKEGPWSYYEHWLAALETVLADYGVLSGPLLDSEAANVLANPPPHPKVTHNPIAVDPGIGQGND